MKSPTKKPRSRLSLMATTAIAFLVLSIVALLMTTILQALTSLQTQQKAIADEQQFIAQDAAHSVTGFIQEKFGVLEAVVGMIDLFNTPKDEQTQILNGLFVTQPAFSQIALISRSGKELSRVTRRSLAGSSSIVDQIDEAAMAKLAQGENYIGPIYIDEITSEPRIVMAVPMKTALGDFVGVLATELNLKFMWDLVDRLQVGETGYAYVVDNQGNLIAFKDTARVLSGENLASANEVSEFVNNPSAPSDATPDVQVYTGLNGETVVGTYVPLGTPQWAVVTELPWQEAYQTTIQQILSTIVIALGMMVLASVAAVFVARRLATPVLSLTSTASRIAAGEVDLQAEVSGPREVADLATAFNSMSISLRKMLMMETTNRVVLEATVQEYLAFVQKVAQGDLTSFLNMDGIDNTEDKDNPLYTLGVNLNLMTNSLAEMTSANAELLMEAQDAREEAEESNRVKSQFLASMSHELRTPLNAILNFSEMMSLGMVGPVTEQQVDILNKSLDSGRHLLELINDVLDITKIQSGSLTLFVEDDLNPLDILASVENTAETLLKNKPVQFVTNIADDLPVISGDKRRIRQILLNLVSNAVKFTEEGSVTLSARRQDDDILFSVKDTGPGISKEQQGIIFEPFVQTATGIRHAGGTGLGLPISKSFVEAHGGKLWVVSETDQGATFSFTLTIHTTVVASIQN